MFKLSKKLTLTLCSCFIALTLTACNSSEENNKQTSSTQETTTQPSQKKEKTYTIGGMYTYNYNNGRYADWGDFALQAAYMALNEINASNMLKYKLQMPENLVTDYHCWPDKAATMTNEILSQNVLAITGVDCSGPAAIIAKETKKQKVPAISYGANASELSSPEEYPYFIRVVTPSETYDGYLVALAAHLNIKDLVFFHTTDTWGLGAKKVINEYANKYNINIVETISYDRGTSIEDMKKLIAHFKEKNYQNFIITAPTPDTVTVFKSFGELDIKNENTRIFAGEMISADETPDTMKGCQGYIAPMTKLPESAALTNFKTQFEKYINKKVVPTSKAFSYAAISYDHIYAIAHAIKALEEQGIEVTNETLMDSLRKVDFQGITGRLAFTPNTNDRAYMHVTFYNNQGYTKENTVNFQEVGSFNPETNELIFDETKVKWQ